MDNAASERRETSPGEPYPKESPEILILDDEEPIRRMLARLLQMNGYDCKLAAGVAEARGCVNDNRFALILSDVNMPGESGLDFARYVLQEHPGTAVVMMTALDDPEVARSALELGAYGYITKPFDPKDVLFNVSNALRRSQLELESLAYQENLERMVLERTAELQEREEKLKLAVESLSRAMEGIVQAMAVTVETRDPYTAGHQRRVANLARAMAEEMGLPTKQIEGTYMAGVIHDLGKIAVPAEILTKPGRITDAEFAIIKEHPQTAYDILKEIEFPWPVAQIVLQHHERINGSGYPAGLSDGKILLEAKILSVADVVEAMASHRPYRPALGIDVALGEISKNRGVLYEPEVADACLKLFREKGFSLEQK